MELKFGGLLDALFVGVPGFEGGDSDILLVFIAHLWKDSVHEERILWGANFVGWWPGVIF